MGKMYLNDLNSAQHSVQKLNKVLADSFDHEVNLAEMSFGSLQKMLTTTNAKIQALKESDLTYWDNPQYNKLNLISHTISTYITEIAPGRSDGKQKRTMESKIMESDLDQAEVLLAARELVDQLQDMAEDIAKMQVQELMPIVDTMKDQLGFEQAEAYNTVADATLGALLDAVKAAKTSLDDATLTAEGKPSSSPAPTEMSDEPDMEMDDEFEGDFSAAGEENPVGRELKGESVMNRMEKDALAEQKFLQSKDKLFSMVKEGKLSQEQFINIINEFDKAK
jgi:TolA-binding protein|tara:strand:- start:409 stop:1248 length:840 start_codon:yes stop_codon:yes gene_type:complete